MRIAFVGLSFFSLVFSNLALADSRLEKIAAQYHKDMARVKKAIELKDKHLRPYATDCEKGLVLGQPGQLVINSQDGSGDPVCMVRPAPQVAAPQQPPAAPPAKDPK